MFRGQIDRIEVRRDDGYSNESEEILMYNLNEQYLKYFSNKCCTWGGH